ncbi:hypothetical protein M422DRAFT_275211 [Sphaerobolus stellatus SS14]|uniref:Uncharacterized protein n=1 Tax=Sphaerobolus stellatus (strain SS14) TaxID=990650 RepID=A0A0C9UFU9_SPHS4|nr:hypothetical protein M422DRAFT_275211 [Sphaerobolus stellatus SS14]
MPITNTAADKARVSALSNDDRTAPTVATDVAISGVTSPPGSPIGDGANAEVNTTGTVIAPLHAVTKEWKKASDKLSYRPFQKTARGEQWAVSDGGKYWITQRLSSFRNMQSPGGLPKDEATNRLMTHRQWWVSQLCEAYMANWPDFDLEEVLGSGYTPAQKKLHDEASKPGFCVRVSKFIEGALRRQYSVSAKESPTDILGLLINRARKPVPYNVWVQNNPKGDAKARDLAQKDPRWEKKGNHLHTLMEMRKMLFEKLPAAEQDVWEKQAQDAKVVNLTPEDCIASIPKVYGTVGDSYRGKVNFNCLVLCGGKGPNDEGWYYVEEWHTPSMNDPLGFTSTKNWKTIQGAFIQFLSKDTGVPPNELVQLETWQRPSEFVPKVVQRLCDVLEWDEAGEILTSVDGARKMTEKYLDSWWGLVPDKNGAPKKTPIPWTEIRRQRDDLGQFIEARRLPTDNFIFERPKDMPKKDLWEFIDHIIKGEKGDIPASRVFRWTRQTDGDFQLAAKPRKQTRTSRKGDRNKASVKYVAPKENTSGEIFDLDGVTSSAESEEDETIRGRKLSRGTGNAPQVKQQASKLAGGEVLASKVAPAQAKEAEPKGSKTAASNPKDKPKKNFVQRSRSRSTKTDPKSPTRKRKRSVVAREAESDADVLNETQVIFSGEATQLFVGDLDNWRLDFDAREAAMEWESEIELDYGAMTLESARFIESGERFDDITFNRILDLSQPLQLLDDDLHELIFDTLSPLPDAADLLKVDWDSVLTVLLDRFDNAINAIIDLSPKADHRWLRLGSSNGVMLLLRLVEFARRVAKDTNRPVIRTRIHAMRKTINVVMAKEAWRRWARTSFLFSLPTHNVSISLPGDLFMLWEIWMGTQMKVDIGANLWSGLKWRRFLEPDTILSKLAHETSLTVRGSEEHLTAVTLTRVQWKDPVAVAAVGGWVKEMDESMFQRACVIERFQYLYAVQMVTWWGGSATQEWGGEAIKNAENWLGKIM